MVKYYYDKYNTVSNTYWVQGPWQGTSRVETRYADKAKGYTFDSVNNQFRLSSDVWKVGEIVPKGGLAYHSGGNFLIRDVAINSLYAQDYLTSDNSQCHTANSTQKTDYSRGSLVQSNIVAEDGTYPNDGRHTDGFWYVRKGVVNQNPIVTPVGSVPSGSMSVKPSFNYKVTDPDGNTMTVTESIDGIVINTRTNVVSGTQFNFNPNDLIWLRTRIKQTVNITIKADDGKGGVATVNYPITRTTPAIDLSLKTPFETDVAARRILLQLEGNISIDANVNVQVCNNAFDANPTWENATSLVLSGFPHPFTNTTKTATKWGVSFKVRIERGSSTGVIILDGVGGAYD